MKFKKIIGFIQIVCFAWMVTSSIQVQRVQANLNIGMGNIGFVETRVIDNGVELEYVMGTNAQGEQKGHTIEIEKGALTPYVTYGDSIYGGERLTSMVNLAETSFSHTVVAAINGDFYDTSNGIPLGMMISNGRFVTSGTRPNTRSILGFKADGSVIFGTPSVSLKFNDGTSDTTIHYLNNDRKLNQNAIYLYSSDYGPTTRNNEAGREVVLNITDGEVKLGSTITATVESIGSNNVAIGEGKLVLSTATANAASLNALTTGKEITITITDNKPNDGWGEVVQALGHGAVLVRDGQVTQEAYNDTAHHPRTAVGIKEDGSLVLFQVDGRQPGWSNGLTYKSIAEHLISKGCVSVVNLDGGGSSTMLARLPGHEKTSMLTSPSDGVERSNSNGIIFFSTSEADPTGTVAHLHTYPKNLIILEGAQTQIEVFATDENYYPVTKPTAISFAASSGLGSMGTTGRFTASAGAKTGTITVSSGSISTVVDVTIVDQITHMVADRTYLSVTPLQLVTFSLLAYKDGMPITASNSSFTWNLSTPLLGTISNGVYRAGSTSTTGSIYISYKSFQLTIPVEVGKQPEMIQTFEDAVMGVNWTSVIENPGNGGVGTVTVNTDERFVKFGEKSLRIDYDFTRATGTTSVTSMRVGSYQTIEGYPTHIGMWVYGDMNNTTVRTLLVDGTGAPYYISYTPEPVTWQGWKYIEAAVPAGIALPIRIKYPIRVMSIGAKPKTAGTLYFDNLRVVYGFRNDDLKEPVITNFTPEAQSVVSSTQPTISFNVKDLPDANDVVTGVKKSSIKMWINGALLSNVIQSDLADGSVNVSYTPSALTQLRPGPQIVKVRAEDNYGNITIREFQFFVEGEYVGVMGVLPDKEVIFAGDTFEYVIESNTYSNFERFSGTLFFNPQALRIISVEKLDERIMLSSGNLANSNTSGSLSLVATGMHELSEPENMGMIKITFGTKDGFRGNSDTNIRFENVLVKEIGYTTATPFLLPSYEAKVNYPYILTYITSTVGRSITFKVTDHLMNPVEGVSFVVGGQSIQVPETTNEQGLVTLSQFQGLAANATFTIKAMKEPHYSETLTVQMVASLRNPTPYFVVVSPGEDASTSVHLSWQTDLGTLSSLVRYRALGESDWVQTTQATTKPIHVLESMVYREYLAHIVRLDGLLPNTEYEYQVGSSSNLSEIKIFKTAPSGDISFSLFGDPQNVSAAGYQITKGAIDAAIATNPGLSMLLFAGDMVDDVNMYSQWQAMESVLQPYFRRYLIASPTGNHDVIRNYSDPFTHAFVGPNNGVDVIGTNYYFEAGNAIIAVIDTETPSAYAAQGEWLKQVMSASDKTFKIVLMHRSAYPANYNELHIRNFWPNIFDQAGIDLVYSGHDHVYNSTTLFHNRKVAPGYGTTYIVGGSTGTKYYNSNNLHLRPWIDFLYDENNPVFTNASIEGAVMELKTYAIVGGQNVLIDTIVIDKNIVKPGSIERTSELRSLQPGEQLQWSATLKGHDGEPFAGTVKWTLKESVEGVSISSAGLLMVSSSLEENKMIEVVAYYEGVEEVYSILVWSDYIGAEDTLEEMIDEQEAFIKNIYE